MMKTWKLKLIMLKFQRNIEPRGVERYSPLESTD